MKNGFIGMTSMMWMKMKKMASEYSAGVSAPVQPTMDSSSIPPWFTAAMDLYEQKMKNYMDHHFESLRRSLNEEMLQLKVWIQSRVMGEADVDCSPSYDVPPPPPSTWFTTLLLEHMRA